MAKTEYVLDDYGYRITKKEAEKRKQSELLRAGFEVKYPPGTVMNLNCAETDEKDERVTIDSAPWIYAHHQIVVRLKERRGPWSTRFISEIASC